MLNFVISVSSLFVIQLASGQDHSHLPPCTSEIHNRHFPSGFDCPSYFTCFNEQYVLQRCSDGFWFDRTREACVISSQVHDCEFAPPTNPPPVTQPTPAPTTIPTTIATTVPTTLPTTISTSPPDLLPNVECHESGVHKVANPFSCTRYYKCFDGVPVERRCSPGLYFSRSQLRCVRRAESDCLLDLDSCPAENDPNNIVFLPDQEDCQRYFVCYDGAPVGDDCGETLHWDPNNNWCVKEEDSECEPNYPLPEVRVIECPEDTESDIIFLPHPEDCQFYFICLDGMSVLARCARNMLFDYVMENCFFAESARCFNINPAIS